MLIICYYGPSLEVAAPQRHRCVANRASLTRTCCITTDGLANWKPAEKSAAADRSTYLARFDRSPEPGHPANALSGRRPLGTQLRDVMTVRSKPHRPLRLAWSQLVMTHWWFNFAAACLLACSEAGGSTMDSCRLNSTTQPSARTTQ